MPKWLDQYAGQQAQRGGDLLHIDQETALGFLRSLRDRGVPAWQRLPAARALEWYPSLVLDRGDVDFAPFKRKLGELAARERRTGGGRDGEGGIPGEGLPGKLDPSEPEAVRAPRARMRVLHHPKSTEEAYAGWLLRFIRHLDTEYVEKYGEPEIGQFVTDLAILGEVTAGTQNQALKDVKTTMIYYAQAVIMCSKATQVGDCRPVDTG